jgi:hypothetical protein
MVDTQLNGHQTASDEDSSVSVRPGGDLRGKSIVGQRVKRLEDPRLITGKGMFVDDLKLPVVI